MTRKSDHEDNSTLPESFRGPNSLTPQGAKTTTKPPHLVLTERDVAEIQLFIDVARANGTHLSLKEAISLVRADVSEQEFLEAWSSVAVLKGEFEIQSGLILARGENLKIERLKDREDERRRWAVRNLQQATEFARLTSGRYVRVFSVSGSSSYGSVSEYDDVDFFCITQKDTMWLFLTRSLLFARIFRIFKEDSRNLCFSCVMDEDFANQLFNGTRDALFARDALKAHVIRGSQFYNDLLHRNDWLYGYYPKLYRAEIMASATARNAQGGRKTHLMVRFANTFLYCFVGRYLHIKADIRNRRFAREGKSAQLFTAKIGRDHCIYESVRYALLRKKYEQIHLLAAVT